MLNNQNKLKYKCKIRITGITDNVKLTVQNQRAVKSVISYSKGC